MTDTELNKWIHKKVMGECIHKYSHHNGGWPVCEKCGKEYDPSNWLPSYTTDLNAAAIAEARVINLHGTATYGEALDDVLSPLGDLGSYYGALGWAATAPARTRCEAMKLAMEDQK